MIVWLAILTQHMPIGAVGHMQIPKITFKCVGSGMI